MFFWWQAGCVAALQQRFDLSGARFGGASAGAIACTMAACDCDMNEAFRLAEQMALREGLQKKGTWGLLGVRQLQAWPVCYCDSLQVWGRMIRGWLHECLPNDAHIRCSGRVTIAARQLPLLNTVLVSQYDSKHMLIDVCMASAHGRRPSLMFNASFVIRVDAPCCVAADASAVPLLLDGRWTADIANNR